MSLYCETVAKYILPVFRSFVAKELVEKHGFSQMEAAKRLGTTQAAISQYLHSKRGLKSISKFESFLPMIQSAATLTAKHITESKINDDDAMMDFCKLCSSLHEKE